MVQANEREKILIVDDNKENIDLLMDIFSQDYRVAAAKSAERAIKLACSDMPPDLILLDILMPGMDGYQVCDLLKSRDGTKHIPVIFVTAVSEVMDAARGFALGAVDYITKPFHPPMVKARVRMHLELKRKQALLEEYAFIDSLTEIPNRRRLDQVIETEFQRALRSDIPLSLILVDIDHFKEFNDTYGHGKGDDCLRQLAKVMEKTLRRAGDFLARYGGEEYMAVLPYTDREAAMATARKIMNAVDELRLPHESSPVCEHVTVSLGVGTLMPSLDDADLGELVERTDKALYAAKRAGRHRIEPAGA